MEATRTTFIIFRTVVCEKKSISQFDFRTSPMIKFYQQTNVNFFERLNQFSNLFHFHFFLFKIKTPGKHSFTHAHVHAGKEFTWFQRNEKSNYHLYPVLDHWTSNKCCFTRNTSNNYSVSVKSACLSSRSLWNHGCTMRLFTKPGISDSTFVAPCWAYMMLSNKVHCTARLFKG